MLGYGQNNSSFTSNQNQPVYRARFTPADGGTINGANSISKVPQNNQAFGSFIYQAPNQTTPASVMVILFKDNQEVHPVCRFSTTLTLTSCGVNCNDYPATFNVMGGGPMHTFQASLPDYSGLSLILAGTLNVSHPNEVVHDLSNLKRRPK